MTEAMQEKIVKMAKHYISDKKATLQSVSLKFAVPYSTTYRYLNVYLKDIDQQLWTKVQTKKSANVNRSRQNFVKPVKKCFLARLFNK